MPAASQTLSSRLSNTLDSALCSVREPQCLGGFIFRFVKMGPLNLPRYFRETMRGRFVLRFTASLVWCFPECFSA